MANSYLHLKTQLRWCPFLKALLAVSDSPTLPPLPPPSDHRGIHLAACVTPLQALTSSLAFSGSPPNAQRGSSPRQVLMTLSSTLPRMRSHGPPPTERTGSTGSDPIGWVSLRQGIQADLDSGKIYRGRTLLVFSAWGEGGNGGPSWPSGLSLAVLDA